MTGDVYNCPAVYIAAADHTCAVDHGAAADAPRTEPLRGNQKSTKICKMGAKNHPK